MAKLADKLSALDERVLHVSRKQEELRTPEGWRRRAQRWRWSLGAAVVLLVLLVVETLARSASALSLVPMFGLLCFRAGQLKAEADRLDGRGFFEQNRPPGL